MAVLAIVIFLFLFLGYQFIKVQVQRSYLFVCLCLYARPYAFMFKSSGFMHVSTTPLTAAVKYPRKYLPVCTYASNSVLAATEFGHVGLVDTDRYALPDVKMRASRLLTPRRRLKRRRNKSRRSKVVVARRLAKTNREEDGCWCYAAHDGRPLLRVKNTKLMHRAQTSRGASMSRWHHHAKNPAENTTCGESSGLAQHRTTLTLLASQRHLN
jgi:hypothetical protein